MKYIITMKDGTQYTAVQPKWWAEYIASCMADGDFGSSVIEADDHSWIVSVDQIAHVHREQEDAA